MIRNFERVCQWLEEQGVSDLYTLAEIHDKTEELSEGSECYSKKYLKEKLVDHYGNHIHFCEHPGRPNLLYFKDMAAWVLEDFKKKSHQGAIDVITAAAKIIKSDIREIPVDKSSLEDLNDTDYEKMGTRELANIS